MKITEIALKNRLSTFVLVFLVVVTGFYSYVNLPKEASPDITIPYIIISTPYFGVSPDDMENLVTNIIERELKTLDDVEEITSTSQESYSSIAVEFVAGTDIDAALQKVRDKVDLAKPDLPKDAEDPIISELNFSDWPIMIINVSGKMGLVGLKKIAEDLEDKIETVPGVIEANITGGLTREVQVNLDPQRLRFYNLAITDVIDAVRNEHLDTPGGSIDIGDTKFLVRIPGEFTVPEKMNDIVVKVNNYRPIYLRDLGQVVYSFKERSSISRLNGVETVSISVQKRSGENLIEIADRVKELIARQQEKLPPGVEIKITGDQSEDIRMMVNELENNVISGLILVVLVLFVVMGVRNAFLV
ncbi:MAG: efflux RND transporter permease subunit, partial [Gemmatimonadota bacterium]|nr:efflux RND transporter permease subunit [Gemmatimonadota bacterium]